MRIGPSSSGQLLGELQLLLASDQLPVQEEVAKASGVHQSLVSRARNGQLKRVTVKVDALLEYARSCVGAEELAVTAAMAIDAETAGSASVVEAGSHRDAEVRGRRRRRGDGAVSEGYTRQALAGVDAYLNEGYDPRLIVEQLAVLRRAQRLRRPGPAASAPSDEQSR